MARARYHFRRLPSVDAHQLHRVACILNRVSRRWLLNNRVSRNSLRLGHPRHHIGFNKPVVRSTTRDNHPRRHATLVFVHCLGYAFKLSGRRISVRVCRVSKDDQHVKMTLRSIFGRRQSASNHRPRRQYQHHRRPSRQRAPLPTQRSPLSPPADSSKRPRLTVLPYPCRAQRCPLPPSTLTR